MNDMENSLKIAFENSHQRYTFSILQNHLLELVTIVTVINAVIGEVS